MTQTKSKTKTAIAVALVTISIVGTVAGMTILVRRNSGGVRTLLNSAKKNVASENKPAVTENKTIVPAPTQGTLIPEPAGIIDLTQYKKYESTWGPFGPQKQLATYYFALVGSDGGGRTVNMNFVKSTWGRIKLGKEQYYKFILDKKSEVEVSFGQACSDEGGMGPSCPCHPLEISVAKMRVPNTDADKENMKKVFDNVADGINAGEKIPYHSDPSSWYRVDPTDPPSTAYLGKVDPGTYYVKIAYTEREFEYLRKHFMDVLGKTISDQENTLEKLRGPQTTCADKRKIFEDRLNKLLAYTEQQKNSFIGGRKIYDQNLKGAQEDLRQFSCDDEKLKAKTADLIRQTEEALTANRKWYEAWETRSDVIYEISTEPKTALFNIGISVKELE